MKKDVVDRLLKLKKRHNQLLAELNVLNGRQDEVMQQMKKHQCSSIQEVKTLLRQKQKELENVADELSLLTDSAQELLVKSGIDNGNS
jgi:seryl-tRNA synthetase